MTTTQRIVFDNLIANGVSRRAALIAATRPLAQPTGCEHCGGTCA